MIINETDKEIHLGSERFAIGIRLKNFDSALIRYQITIDIARGISMSRPSINKTIVRAKMPTLNANVVMLFVCIAGYLNTAEQKYGI